MEPLHQSVKRAPVLLANIHASRLETIPRVEPVNAIRREEQFAIRMGISSEYFRRQVVNHVLLRMRTGEHEFRRVSETYDLESTLLKILGGGSLVEVERRESSF